MSALSKGGIALCVFLIAIPQADAQGVITTVAGTTWVFRGDGGPAVGAPLGAIQAVAVDSANNVYVTERVTGMLFKVSPTGTLTVFAGNGIFGFSGDGGPATGASISQPFGVAVDAAGNVYFADTDNHRIRKIALDGTITTVAGNGSAGFSGDDGPAASAALNRPNGVAVDTAGNLYITDSVNNRLRKVTPDGTIATIAGTGSPGFAGDGGPAGSALLNNPAGVAVDSSGNLYILDTNNLRVRKVGPTGTISTFAGSGARGFLGDGGPAANASFASFTGGGIAVDAVGSVYVTDQANHRIRKVSPDGTITTVAGSAGGGGFSGDGGPATSAALNNPAGLAVDGAGNLYIADLFNGRLRKVASIGTISTAAGGGPFKFSGDGGPATSAAFNGPHGVAIDAAGNLLIVDTFSNRIRSVTRSGMVNTVAGAGTAGFSGDGGPATSALLRSPYAVAADGSGNLYISDTSNNRVRKVSPAGVISTVAGGGSGLGENGPATSASLTPYGLAVDASNNLYLADRSRNLIRKVGPNGILTTVAGNLVAGFSGDGGPATLASLSLQGPITPIPGVAVDAAGNLYVSDLGNHRIRKVSSAGIITTIAGNGTAGFSGDGGPATDASLNSPSGLAVDRTGNVYFADTANHRVRKVSPAGIITTVAGNGVAGLSGDGGPSTSASLNGPQAVALDAAGNLYIVERFNDRVRKVLDAPPAFSVTPLSLGFSAAAGAPVVASLEIAVSSEVLGMGWSAQATTQAGGAWLSVSSTTGATPGAIAVSVNAASLAPGTYQGAVTVTAPLATPATRSVPVQLTVTASLAAQLSVEPSALTFQAKLGAGNPAAQVLRVGNAGSGTLNWTVQASTQSGGAWLTVSSGSGSAVAGSPASVQVSSNAAGLTPGVYSGSVRVTSATTRETKTIAVTLLVSQITQTILVTQSGLLFTGVEAASGVPPQTLGILNTGQGMMNWTVRTETLSGGSWLSASPTSGQSVADSLTVPLVEVRVNLGSLRAGQYSGLLRVEATGADNSPQFVTVELNVLPPGSNPGVQVRPTGLIFAARAGTSSPGSQRVGLSKAAPGSVEARGGLLTFDGGNWLEAVPRNLVVTTAETPNIVVQPGLGTLVPGVYRAAMTLIFADGSPAQTVNILFLVVSASGATSPSKLGALAGGAQQDCVPGRLHAMQRELGNNFVSSVGSPSPVEVQVIDDCGSDVRNANVVASFSNGDPPMTLASLRNGLYAGTWRPLNVAGRVAVTVRASLPPLEAAVVQAQGTVQANPNAPAPALFTGGLVNGASFAPGEAVAPGSIIAVFGRNLAASDGATSLPLPTTLGGATLSIGGVDAPLFYSGDGQMNAQIPFELKVATRPQAVVKHDISIAGPETITIAAVAPGIFTTNQQGSGEGAILDSRGRLVDAASPAAASDVVQVFCTGLGATNPEVTSGQASPSSEPLARTVAAVTATVGGLPATVQFAGLAPGFVGLYQVNVQIPSGIAAGSASLVLNQNGVPSNTVTLATR